MVNFYHTESGGNTKINPLTCALSERTVALKLKLAVFSFIALYILYLLTSLHMCLVTIFML